jgi:hypothetical protein
MLPHSGGAVTEQEVRRSAAESRKRRPGNLGDGPHPYQDSGMAASTCPLRARKHAEQEREQSILVPKPEARVEPLRARVENSYRVFPLTLTNSWASLRSRRDRAQVSRALRAPEHRRWGSSHHRHSDNSAIHYR